MRKPITPRVWFFSSLYIPFFPQNLANLFSRNQRLLILRFSTVHPNSTISRILLSDKSRPQLAIRIQCSTGQRIRSSSQRTAMSARLQQDQRKVSFMQDGVKRKGGPTTEDNEEEEYMGWAWQWESIPLKDVKAVEKLTEMVKEAEEIWGRQEKKLQSDITKREKKKVVTAEEEQRQDKELYELERLELKLNDNLLKVKRSHVFEAQNDFLQNQVNLRASYRHLVKPQLFWYRFFDVGTVDVEIAEFAHALWIFLLQELGGPKAIGLTKKDFRSVISITMDTESREKNVRKGDSRIAWFEWMKFVLAFGPLNSCFTRARALCSEKDLERGFANPDENDEAQAIIFAPTYDRLETTKKLRITPEPAIIVRQGRGPYPEHVMSVSLKRGQENMLHYKVGLRLPQASDQQISTEQGGYYFSGKVNTLMVTVPDLVAKALLPRFANSEQNSSLREKYTSRIRVIESQLHQWTRYDDKLEAEFRIEDNNYNLALLFYKSDQKRRKKLEPAQTKYLERLEKEDWEKEKKEKEKRKQESKDFEKQSIFASDFHDKIKG
eukprot:g81622.t1